jgi:hypothetical protein
MKHLLALILISICFSCTKKVVQLPETTNQDITEVLDISPIYMFYDEETDSVEFNRKNMISTTNWLVNIDKRLTLKQILPHLQYLQDKRQGDGMHKNENARNYFTCNNTELKNLSFIEFTDLVFKIKNYNDIMLSNDLEDAAFSSEILERFTNNIDSQQVKFKRVIIESIDRIHLSGTIYSSSEFIKSNLNYSLKNYSALFFYINSKLTFQDYITIESLIKTIESNKLKVSNYHVIYN